MITQTWKQLTKFQIQTVPKMSIEERFWSKVAISDDESCWQWKASTDAGGYGRCWTGSEFDAAHRMAWKLNKGPIPKGIFALHKCDNRRCCNPTHLFLGTQAENIKDMMQKERNVSPRGEQNGRAKLTSSDVKEIRLLFTSGRYNQKQLRARFHISSGAMSNVVRNKSYCA